MSKKLCVYTCITGDYDDLHEIEKPEKGVDYYCFTNNKNLKSKTWKIVQIKNDGLDNQRLSRKIKMLGEPSIMKDYEVSVWMDASVVWNKSVIDFVETYLGDGVFAAFLHSQRSSVRDEAIACLRLRKDSKEKIEETLRFLNSEGFRDDIGLFEMTVFAKRHHDKTVQETMKIWFDALQRYSKRDQLSFPYAIWKTGLQVNPISLNVWDNEWFSTIKHRISPNINDCLAYFGNPDVNFDFSRHYKFDYTRDGSTFSFQATLPVDTQEIEFNFGEAAGAKISNITVLPKPSRVCFYGIEDVGSESFVCAYHNIIRVFGNYKSGDRLSFSIDIDFIDNYNLLNLLENVWSTKNTLVQKNDELLAKNARLKAELEGIRNSRTWKLVSKARKIIRRS